MFQLWIRHFLDRHALCMLCCLFVEADLQVHESLDRVKTDTTGKDRHSTADVESFQSTTLCGRPKNGKSCAGEKEKSDIFSVNLIRPFHNTPNQKISSQRERVSIRDTSCALFATVESTFLFLLTWDTFCSCLPPKKRESSVQELLSFLPRDPWDFFGSFRNSIPDLLDTFPMTFFLPRDTRRLRPVENACSYYCW